MHFCMDADDGDGVRLWLAPDNPSAIPKLVVVRPGEAELTVEANVLREDIRDMGLHETGQVGFALGETALPGIAGLDAFTLLEAESRLPLYRRHRAAPVLPHKLCLFDTAAAGDGLRAATAKHFSLAYFAAETIPLETMMSVINNHFTASIFIHGRPSAFRYAAMLNGAGFKQAALLTDPHLDLAARLLHVKAQAAGAAAEPLREQECLAPLAEALPLDDPKGMAAALRDAAPRQLRALADPMTRLFACEPNEAASPRHVSLALETLAAMDLVGARDRFDMFGKTLRGLLGADVFAAESFAMTPQVHSLARTLSQIRLVNELLENDIILYSWAEQAVGAATQLAGR